MNDYLIVTDSTSDLTPELVETLDITLIPMEFQVDEKSYYNYPDGREIGFSAFYNLLRQEKNATTAQINFIRYTEIFEPILKEGRDLLYICFSSGLSGSYNSALAAAQGLRESYPDRKVVVVDSLSASMGEGLLVYLAVQEKKKGRTIEELEQWLMEHRCNLCHWFTVDDLNHLKRGGRVSAASAFVGTMLNIKPVLHVDNEGHLIPMEKVRGRRKSLDALVEHMEKTAIDPQNQVIFISHGDCEEDAEYVAQKVRERFGIKELYINFIGPVIGSHSGPGTVALFFLGTER